MKSCHFAAATVALVLTSGFSATAHAQTVDTTMQVSLTLEAACTIVASDMDFGTAGLLTNNVNANAPLTVTCSNGTAYDVGLDQGTATGSEISNRLLQGTPTGGGAVEFVEFNLYRDADYALVWGNTIDTDTYAGTGNGAAQTITVFGQVPVQNTAAVGVYQTTITANITF